MPATARSRGLADPFDPDQAIAKSAEFLRDLVDQFGNFGLAAAAYNAGPQRVSDWLSGRKVLPGETRAYVRIITGYALEDWTRAEPSEPETAIDELPPCPELEAIAQRASRRPARASTDAVFRHRSGASAVVLLRVSQGHAFAHSRAPSGKRPKIKSRAERPQAQRPRIHRV
jgi:transglycosylase-like protein with SLT domain